MKEEIVDFCLDLDDKNDNEVEQIDAFFLDEDEDYQPQPLLEIAKSTILEKSNLSQKSIKPLGSLSLLSYSQLLRKPDGLKL